MAFTEIDQKPVLRGVNLCFRPEGNTYLFVFKLASINFSSSRQNSEGAEDKKERKKFLAWYVGMFWSCMQVTVCIRPPMHTPASCVVLTC